MSIDVRSGKIKNDLLSDLDDVVEHRGHGGQLLVAEARATTDDTKRAELYASAQELMLRDLPYIVPFFQDTLIANRDDVDAWNEYPRSGSLYIENVWLDRA